MVGLGFLGVAALALPGPLLVQATQDQSPATEVEALNVTGEVEPVRTSIDRTSYDLTRDLNATAGSVSDVLRNIPPVQVDVQGNVSVRGQGVRFTIDGKPAQELQGAAGSIALQVLPAGRFDRLELITNPTAAESPEGGAVINLVTRRGTGEGVSWQARVNLSERGTAGTGVFGSYNTDKLALNGDLNFRRRTTQFFTDETRLATDPVSGVVRRSDAHVRIGDDTETISGRIGATYEASSKVQLSGSLRYSQAPVDGLIVRDESGSSGRVLANRWRSTPRGLGAEGGWRRTFDRDDHQLSVDVRADHSTAWTQESSTIAGPSPFGFERFDRRRGSDAVGLDAEYTRPLDGATLTLGTQLEDQTQEYLHVRRSGADAVSAVVDPISSGAFDYHQRLSAAYGTYETTLGKATLVAGLRFEDVGLDLRERATGFASAPGYSKFYPSLHAEYPVSEAVKLKASYSRRVVRPGAEQLNPARILNGELNYEEGNPLLQPVFGNAYETSLEYRRGGALFRAGAFLRRGDGMIVDTFTPLAGGGLLVRPQNMGRHQVTGLELSANGKLSPTLSYNVSAQQSWRDVTASPAGPPAFEGSSFNARGTFDWQATPKDLLQVTGQYVGRITLPQGHAEPNMAINLGYRRRVNDRLSTVLTVSDVFETIKGVTVIDAPTLQGKIDQRGKTRTVALSLVWSVGAKARPVGFEF